MTEKEILTKAIEFAINNGRNCNIVALVGIQNNQNVNHHIRTDKRQYIECRMKDWMEGDIVNIPINDILFDRDFWKALTGYSLFAQEFYLFLDIEPWVGMMMKCAMKKDRIAFLGEVLTLLKNNETKTD